MPYSFGQLDSDAYGNIRHDNVVIAYYRKLGDSTWILYDLYGDEAAREDRRKDLIPYIDALEVRDKEQVSLTITIERRTFDLLTAAITFDLMKEFDENDDVDSRKFKQLIKRAATEIEVFSREGINIRFGRETAVAIHTQNLAKEITTSVLRKVASAAEAKR